MYHTLSLLTHHQFSHYERFFGCVLLGNSEFLKLQNSALRYSGHSREMQNFSDTLSANFLHSSALCGFTLRCSTLGQCNRSFIQYRRIGCFRSPQLFFSLFLKNRQCGERLDRDGLAICFKEQGKLLHYSEANTRPLKLLLFLQRQRAYQNYLLYKQKLLLKAKISPMFKCSYSISI